MKEYLALMLVFGMLLVGQIANATSEIEPFESLEILADNNVNNLSRNGK